MATPQRSTSHTTPVAFSPKRVRSTLARSHTGSISSFLWGHRGSVAFRIGKSGFKVPRYQNTYQLESLNPFNYVVVDKIVKSVMTKSLTGVEYNPIICLKLCKDMAVAIRQQIYKKDYHRYKYIVSLTIIQKTGQGIDVKMGYVWDTDRDAYSKFVFENREFYAIGLVVGVYYE